MKVCVVTESDLNGFWKDKLDKVTTPDLLIFGNNGLGLVSYKKELEGITEYFQDVAKLSSEIGGVLISGCDTDTYGVFRHSAVIADRGKILGVSDMIHSVDDSEFLPGGTFRVYDTSVGKIGITIGEDLYFPEVARVLTLCDADIIVSLFGKATNSMPEIMTRSAAFANGVTAILCANGVTECADIRGNLLFSVNGDITEKEIRPEKDYHLVSSRRRGIYRDFSSGY